MTLREYYKKLGEFIKENPKALDLTVIHSVDDEGNDFTPVVFDPGTLMKKDGRDFVVNADSDEDATAVCIN